jgi:hypothetical protein
MIRSGHEIRFDPTGDENPVFHRDSTVYHVTSEDPPERRFEVAKNHLAGTSPRIAESLLGECVRTGFGSSEVAYYYALATLSERSLHQLGPNELEHMRTALSIAERGARDEWHRAISVIRDLLQCVIEQETSREPDSHTLATVLTWFTDLEQSRQEEITRHLDMITGGALQDQADRVMATAVEQERMSGHRAERAWKFFQPEPAEPRWVDPYFAASSSPRAWGLLVPGALGFVACLGLPGAFHDLSVSVLSIAATLLVGLTCATTAWFGGHAVGAHARRRRLEYELGNRAGPRSGDEAPDLLGSPLFRRRIRGMISHRLDREQPLRRKERQKWQADLASPARSLFVRLVRTYGKPPPEGDESDTFRQRESEVDAVSLNWLIDAQIRAWSRQHADGTLFAFRRITVMEIVDRTVAALSALLATYEVYEIFRGLGGTPSAILVCLCTAAAAAVGTWGWTTVLGNRLAFTQEWADCWRRLEWEQDEYRKWQDKLADRPTDAEMARWLDFDKAHLKTEAMRHADLTDRDIVGQVVLAEGMPRARRARVIQPASLLVLPGAGFPVDRKRSAGVPRGTRPHRRISAQPGDIGDQVHQSTPALGLASRLPTGSVVITLGACSATYGSCPG